MWSIGSLQEAVEAHLEIGSDTLNESHLLLLQRLIKDVNPYAQAYRNCSERLQAEPNPQARVELKQHDPNKANKGTHNRPSSSGPAAVIVLPENLDMKKPIDRDILVQHQNGGLILIPYWQSCYMPLRYPLTYPYGEQSWNVKFPLRGHHGSNILAQRNQLQLHNEC